MLTIGAQQAGTCWAVMLLTRQHDYTWANELTAGVPQRQEGVVSPSLSHGPLQRYQQQLGVSHRLLIELSNKHVALKLL